MREAGRISALALRTAAQHIRPGLSTADLDRLIRAAIEQEGAAPNFLGLYGFPASACISLNDEVIHGIPGRQIIREGDIVSVDVGAVKGGWHGDNAYTFPVGQIAPPVQKLLDVTQKALQIGIAAAMPGARVGDIGAAIQKYAEENGFSVVRQYVGHGIGQKLHEEPEVPNFGTPGRGARLAPGMTLAIEPMINAGTADVYTAKNGWTVHTKDGAPSAHYEHTILITEKGAEILTKEGDLPWNW